MPDRMSTELEIRALNAVRDYGVQMTLFRNAMDEWAGHNATDMESLRLLFLEGVSTPSRLARHTGLTSGATTAMLDRLENAGLIERKPNPEDRRGTLIYPSRSSAEKAAAWFEPARNAQAELMAQFSEKELEIIYLIGELNRQLGNFKEAIRWFEMVVRHEFAFKNRLIKNYAKEQWALSAEQYNLMKTGS